MESYVSRFGAVWKEDIWFIAFLSIVSFFVPFLIGSPQWFVGIVVNFILVISASRLPLSKCIPIMIIPSLAAYSRGIVFGPYSVFLLYLIPFIWVGNFGLVILIQNLKKNRWTKLVLASIAKSAVIFASVLMLVVVNLVPSALIIPMSIMQLVTALAGGIIAYWALAKLIPKKG
jgi:hypothetical protein